MWEVHYINLSVLGYKTRDNLVNLIGAAAAALSSNPVKAVLVVLQGSLSTNHSHVSVLCILHPDVKSCVTLVPSSMVSCTCRFHFLESFIYDEPMTNDAGGSFHDSSGRQPPLNVLTSNIVQTHGATHSFANTGQPHTIKAASHPFSS